MKLYGYSGEVEKKFDQIDEASKNKIVSDMLLERLNVDMEKVTLGDFFLKLFSYAADIPEKYWSMTKSEITEEDIKLLYEKLDKLDIKIFEEVPN